MIKGWVNVYIDYYGNYRVSGLIKKTKKAALESRGVKGSQVTYVDVIKINWKRK